MATLLLKRKRPGHFEIRLEVRLEVLFVKRIKKSEKEKK
jgi:hypothetical protein